MEKIKIFIVDDHDMFREGVKLLLSSSNQTEIVGEAVNGKQFIDQLDTIQADIVLMDIAMPVMDGIEATKIAQSRKPELKLLALTMFGDEKYYYQMIQGGIKGFVLKSSGISELLKAINEVYLGGSFFSGELLIKLVESLSKEKNDILLNDSDLISKRELEVLKEISAGLTNEEISEKLHIGLTTVRTHRSNLLNKTGCNNTASLVMYAIKHKIISV